MDTMPERYDTHQTTTVEQRQTRVTIGLNLPYIRSLPGILKLVEATLSLIVLICVACVTNWGYISSGGFIIFVAVMSMITTLVIFGLHLINVIYLIPGPMVLVELIYICGVIIFYLAASCVAAAFGSAAGGAVAAALFGFAATAVYAVEAAVCFKVWREGGSYYVASVNTTNNATGRSSTTTTTTATTVKSHETYATP